MKIQLKRSNQLQDYGNGNEAKKPTALQMEHGELAVNYNAADPAIFIEDSNGNIVRIAGEGAEGTFSGDYNDLSNLPTIGDGTITIKNSDGSNNTSFSVNQTGPTEVTLPAGFSGDYGDLTNQPTIGDANLVIKNDAGTTLATFSANATADVELNLPAGTTDTNTTYTITSQNDADADTSILRLTAGGDGTGDQDIKLEGANGLSITQTGNNKFVFTIPDAATVYPPSTTPPNAGNETNGDIWIDTSECPPELKVWSDCSGTGQWEGIEGIPDLVVIKPTLSGNPSQGAVLTSTEGQAVGGKAPFTFTYNFKDQNNTVLQSSAARTYTLLAGDVGKTVTVDVTALDSRGTSETSDESNAIGPIVPPETVNAPTLLTPANSSTDLSVSSITLTCSAYSGVQSVYGSTTWQVSTVSDFSSTVYDVTNSNQTSNVATFSPALDYDGTYYARCRHTSSTSIASDFSNVNTFTTQSDPVDPNFPSATMSGLRFDENRKTHLTRGKTNINRFTFSFWVKTTSTVYQRIIQDDQGSGAFFIWSESGVIKAGNTSGSASSPLTNLVWSHCVVAYDGTNLSLTVDGGTTSTEAVSISFSTSPWRISGNSSETSLFNGYLSEVYFVDGKALEPTVFGKEFPDGRWGPLDSSIITDNIDNSVVQPYDTRANTDQVWTTSTALGSGVSTNGGEPIDNIYNGETTFCRLVGGAVGVGLTLSPSSLTATKIEIKPSNGANSSSEIKVNGTSYGISAVGTEELLVADLGAPTSITSIEFLRGSGTDNYGLYYIKVDGRLLVDQSVWNNSQNWSDGLTTPDSTILLPSAPVTNAFDGNTNTYCDVTDVGKTLDLVFPLPGLTYTDKIEVFVRQKNVNASVDNGSAVQVQGDNTSFAWATVDSGPKTITSLQIIGTTNFCALAGVRVDGAILVDAGPTWDTSQVWSSGTGDLTSAGAPPIDAFDGNIETQMRGPITFVMDNQPTAVTNIRLYGNKDGDSGSNWFYTKDGAEVNIPQGDWTSKVVDLGPGRLDGFRSSNGKGGIGIVEIDGEILVDPGNFGANGFYLPFDPTATGANYSSAGADNTSSLGNAFNTNTTTFWTPTSNGTSTYTFKTAISVITSLRIFMGSSTATTNFAINGTAPAGFTGANPDAWYDFTDHVSGTLSSITVARQTGNYLTSVAAIEVNGEILVDHNSIGVDASGNKNNFHDENFAINTSGGVYTGSYTGTPFEGFWRNIFNGERGVNAVSTVSTYTSSGDTTMTLTTQFSGQVTVYASSNAGTGDPSGAEVQLTHAGGTKSVPCAQQASGNPAADHGIDAGNLTDVSAITIKQAGTGTKLYWIEVDGVMLVDANFQDTVTDTPMKSYAVLKDDNNQTANQASNGNLQGNGVGGYTTPFAIQAGSKVYYEVTGFNSSASTMGVGISRTASNTSSIPNTNIDALNKDGSFYPGTSSSTNLFTIGTNDVIGVAIDEAAKTITFSQNGVIAAAQTYTGSTVFGYVLGLLSVNFGQQPFVHTPPSGYGGLYQTWDEYATFGLFVYDANQGKAIRTFELNKTYGIRDVLTAANIFRLTAQPRYKVISYIKNNGEYIPLEDVSEQLIAANATISSLQNELDTTQAELATASENIATSLTARAAIEVDVDAILTRLSGLESDEIVDDATDTTLLTAFASLVARVEALENP